jgi:hypothetical protein
MDNIEREKLRRKIFGTNKPTNVEVGPEVNPELLKLFSKERLKRIMTKELRRFRQRQGVKWSRWLQAVSK